MRWDVSLLPQRRVRSYGSYSWSRVRYAMNTQELAEGAKSRNPNEYLRNHRESYSRGKFSWCLPAGLFGGHPEGQRQGCSRKGIGPRRSMSALLMDNCRGGQPTNIQLSCGADIGGCQLAVHGPGCPGTVGFRDAAAEVLQTTLTALCSKKSTQLHRTWKFSLLTPAIRFDGG